MKIEELEIENFRAIEKVSIDTRSTMIVIAGPNELLRVLAQDAGRVLTHETLLRRHKGSATLTRPQKQNYAAAKVLKKRTLTNLYKR